MPLTRAAIASFALFGCVLLGGCASPIATDKSGVINTSESSLLSASMTTSQFTRPVIGTLNDTISETPSSTISVVKAISAKVLQAVAIQAAFMRPSQMVPDQVAGGVWFWSQDSTTTELFHLSDSGHVDTFNMGDPQENGLQTALLTPIAVGPDGDVWIASGSTLVRFDPVTRKTQMWKVPIAGIAGINSQLSAISGVAVAGKNTVAVAVDFAQGVPLLDPKTGKFTILDTKGRVVSSVAGLADGTVVIGSGQHNDSSGSIEWVAPDGAVKVSATPALNLTVDGSEILDTAGSLYKVGNGQTGALLAQGSNLADGAGGLNLTEPVAVAPSGAIVASTRSGLRILSQAGDSIGSLTLPGFSCAGISGNGSNAPDTSPTCPQRALAISVDNDGSIFFFTSGPSKSVEEVPASVSVETAKH